MDLKPVGLFAEMSDGDLKKLGKQMREVRHPRGAKPVLRGKDGVGFMVILEGQAEVSTVDGRHRLLGPGDHFGEMALIDQPEVAYRLLQTLSRRLREAEEAKENR